MARKGSRIGIVNGIGKAGSRLGKTGSNLAYGVGKTGTNVVGLALNTGRCVAGAVGNLGQGVLNTFRMGSRKTRRGNRRGKRGTRGKRRGGCKGMLEGSPL